MQFDDTLLLIEPESAKNYEAGLKKISSGDQAGSDGGNKSTMSGGNAGGSFTMVGQGGTGTITGTSKTTPKPKTFHGSVQINPSTAKMRMVEVADEVIAVPAGDPNAILRITVEISAEFPGGASDHIKRAVTENASKLVFQLKDWE